MGGKVQIHQGGSLVSPRPPLRKEVDGSEDWLASGVPNRCTVEGWGPMGRWAHKAALSGLSAARQLVVASSRRQKLDHEDDSGEGVRNRSDICSPTCLLASFF